jgi:hypothetical protein
MVFDLWSLKPESAPGRQQIRSCRGSVAGEPDGGDQPVAVTLTIGNNSGTAAVKASRLP